ncbi:four-carbon acid sugar kinase family protein [Saccharopolyspora cebuensis]|uniref:Four-carbon acid sugar kinase family protein n=1 Tax=Saccharopolyspora cebuensis TaxID=418759 RepID=A0ABV4CA74_9PSEU
MGTEVLVVADDLSGAGDSGVPFAVRELRTLVSLRAAGTAEVVVVDTDSRGAAAPEAARRVAGALRAHGTGRLVLKKVDSTLRGNLAAEVGALAEHAAGAGVLLCPASPATGRTVLGGVVHLGGTALHRTDAWRAETAAPPPAVAAALEPLRVRHLALPTVRGEPERLRARLAALLAPGDVVIADAVTGADLRALVEAGVALPRPPHWAGAAGLAEALADRVRPGRTAAALPAVSGPVLTVVGSASAVSRAQAEVLAARGARHVDLPVRRLLADPAGSAGPVRRALDAGDAVVTLGGPVDPAAASRIGAALAGACAGAGDGAALLVLTGGETARAVLARRGTTALRLIAELEPGVVLARADPGDQLVITKAGGFGAPEALHRAIAAVRPGRA